LSLFLSLFLGAFLFIKGWQGFIIYKCARNNVSNLSTILFMWSVSRRRRLETDHMKFCVCVCVCFGWLGNCTSWWICCTMSKYGNRKMERNISLQECLVPAASCFKPSKAFIYFVLWIMEGKIWKYGCRNRYRVWNRYH
jgi:hypothetical protein